MSKNITLTLVFNKRWWTDYAFNGAKVVCFLLSLASFNVADRFSYRAAELLAKNGFRIETR